MTFKPTSPGDVTPVTLDPYPPGPTGYQSLKGVACPSASQCTAVDWYGAEVTFNPNSPGTPTPVTLDPLGHILWAVACPSTTQCTAVNENGDELTFDPRSTGVLNRARVDPNHGILRAVACPSVSQCTAVDDVGYEVTFNPTSPGTPTPVEVTGGGRPTIWGVACPSTTQCTAVDNDEDEVTFNPTSPGNVTRVEIGAPFAVACPSTNQCTAIVGSLEVAKEVTFDPTLPSRPVPARLGSLLLFAVACPSASQCTAVQDTRHIVTFNPSVKVRCVVPSVKGKSLAAARMDITTLLCGVGKVTKARSRKVAKGRVAFQAPRAGKRLRVGSKVSLVVSRGR
jgi:hypothetical protein